MAGIYAFDIETNGFLQELTKIHCIWLCRLDRNEEPQGFADQPGHRPIKEALKILADADTIVGHHIIGFDIPAIEKVHPNWSHSALVRDTLVMTRMFWPHIKNSDFDRHRAGTLPGQLIGLHKLEAWGYRMGILKDEYKGGWEEWNQSMHDYCRQDVVVTKALWNRCCKQADKWGVSINDTKPEPGKDCIELEHRVAEIVRKVEAHGWRFDRIAAAALAAKLTKRYGELTEQLQLVFPARIVETPFTPKANNKKYGYVKGVPMIKRATIVFDPSSRQEVARRFRALGWEPEAFGKDGHPTIDDDILAYLENTYPNAKLIREYYTVEKRLGQVVNGKEAWLRHERHGRIHGQIHSNGAHTGRMTHSKPNVAQVPKVGKPYGEECRSCFLADHGYVLVGCDADALELRDLAGYMATFDGGAYIETVLRGDKAAGTDMHSINMRFINKVIKAIAKALDCSRDTAKVFFYAMIYGSGDLNLGLILGAPQGKAKVIGRAAKKGLLEGIPALGKLVKLVEQRIGKKGFVRGLDGRRLFTRSKNAALNTLLQSAGAIQMKRALIILFDDLIDKGWQWGKEFTIVGLIHDEWQANVLPHLADEYGQTAADAIRKAGEFYSFKCPLAGNYDKGGNWAETH
jgi:hypothetical protein